MNDYGANSLEILNKMLQREREETINVANNAEGRTRNTRNNNKQSLTFGRKESQLDSLKKCPTRTKDDRHERGREKERA